MLTNTVAGTSPRHSSGSALTNQTAEKSLRRGRGRRAAAEISPIGLLKALVSIALLLTVTNAFAADYYWDANGGTAGTGGTGTWSTANTWRTGSATGTLVSWPGATNNAFMEGTAGTLTLSGSVTMGTSGTAFFNVTGYTLAPEAITTRQLTGNVVVGNGLNLNINATGSTGNQTLSFFGNVTGGTATLQGAPGNGNASRINVAASGTLASAISINTTGVGNAGIVGLSTGAVVTGAITNLSATNRTMIGATTGNDLTLRSTAIISGSSGLQFAAGSSGGAGTVLLQSQSTYTGPTEFNAANSGIIRLGVTNALPATTDVVWAFSNSNGGILDLNGYSQEFASLTKANTTGTGSIRNNGGGSSVLKISGTAAPAAFSIPIVDNTSGTGTVSIERAGTGSLTLSASNSFSGPTTVSSGTLVAGNAFAFGAASGKVIAAGGVLDLGAFSISRTGTVSLTGGTVQNGTLTNDVVAFDGQAGLVSATLSGSAGLAKTTAGTLVLGGSNAYTGPTTLSAGTLRSGTGTVGNFAFGSGTLALNGGTLTSGTDNQARTFANAVTIGGNVALGDATATGGLAFSGSANLGGASRTLTIVQSTTFSGPIANGGVVKAGNGTLTLSSGSNTFSGGTTLNAGTLVAGNAAAFGSGAINVNGGTLDLGSFAINNAVNINGGSLANAASYSGATTITGTVALASVPNSAVTVAAGGVLQGTPTVASLGGAGLVSPGSSPGILTAGTLDPSGGIDFALEFTGTAPDYGNAGSSINDVVRLTAVSPFVSSLSAGNVIDVYLNVGSITVNDTYQGGFFTTLSANDLLTALSAATFNFFGKAAGGSVTFNGESYNPLTSFVGITGANVSTTAVTANFGGGAVSGSGMQFVIVPEPSAFALAGLGVALVGYASWKRRRSA